MHEGQLTLSAPAAFVGAITLLVPTISTTWNDTATVVHALQLASANALFVLPTGAPSFTVTSEYATLYMTALSFVLTATACVPPGPGAFGSVNGNAAACTEPDGVDEPELAGADVVVVVVAAVVVSAVVVVDAAGVPSLTIATAGSSPSPGITKRAGCSFVAPPTGIIATARCVPGVSFTAGGAACAD